MVADEPHTQSSDDIKTTAIHWLFGQQANTTALYLILIAIGYFAWYLVTTGIPTHLTMIQSGYEKVAEENRKCQDKCAAQYEAGIKAVSDSFEKALDRIERVYEGKGLK